MKEFVVFWQENSSLLKMELWEQFVNKQDSLYEYAIPSLLTVTGSW